MGWGSTSDPRFLPAMIITGVGVLAALAVFVPMWIKSSKTSDQLQVLAQAEGWDWADSVPGKLREALSKLYVRHHWQPSKVMIASRAGGTAYFFHFEYKVGTIDTGTTYRGIACLIEGRTRANAPIYTIGQYPPGAARSLVALKPDVQTDIGGPAFRERFYIETTGYTGHTEEGQTELEPVEIPPALEKELLGWSGPTAQGLPDGWSSATIRDQLVLVSWTSRDDVSVGAWRGLLTKAEKISQILLKN
ncbi:hypothetical protein [Pelagibius sp. Alg239-R121]|uniref:hypothetical protein n=1 Tax=Pelagibius sp. Alg239-R121 TaxID=2993448 RepID=UPI0024A79BDB|nr:hypothetical protein [Pelagibius sp. Alg239-R121]